MNSSEKEKQRASQCMREHSYSVSIEGTLVKLIGLNPLSMNDKRDVVNLEISADFISHNPFYILNVGYFII